MATADTAAVLISVTAEALSTASGSPVSWLDSSTMPWWLSSPTAGFPGVMLMALRPYPVPAWNDGISPIIPGAPSGLRRERSGWKTSPRARAARQVRMVCAHSG